MTHFFSLSLIVGCKVQAFLGMAKLIIVIALIQKLVDTPE